MQGRTRFSAYASLVIALLMAIASLGGVMLASTYARETPSWRTQGIGQDWANLLVAVPWLVVAAVLALRGSWRARLVLAGALVYCVYSYAIYALDVAFNGFFLVYCAIFGLASFALVLLATELRNGERIPTRVPRRAIAGFEMGAAGAFALLWLADIVPAQLHGGQPSGLAEAGLSTNPVHVLDLSLVLPTMFLGGLLLWRRHHLGFVIAPVMLAFAVLMGAAIVAMGIALYAAQLDTSARFVLAFGLFELASLAALVWLLWSFRSPDHARPEARIGCGIAV